MISSSKQILQCPSTVATASFFLLEMDLCREEERG